MKKNEQKNDGAKVAPEILTTEEKAQYEVFTNGGLPRETIEKWIRNDLTATLSFISGCLKEKSIFDALVDAYFEKYKALHTKNGNDGKEASN